MYGNIGIRENQMETTIVYWVSIGILQKKMEITITHSGLAQPPPIRDYWGL